MNKVEVTKSLNDFRTRLMQEVLSAYQQRGESYGRERFDKWKSRFSKFLDAALPGESSNLDKKLEQSVFYRGRSESDADVFWREDGEPSLAFVDSLLIDVENDEYDLKDGSSLVSPALDLTNAIPVQGNRTPVASRKIFVVHGHDNALKMEVARFVERLGYEAIILHEQANRGKTIIEKIEEYTDVGFAIVLYMSDDQGASNTDASAGTLRKRARQNVVFEHGYLMAKLGRDRVVPLVESQVELPSDISGVVYVSGTSWKLDVAREMAAADYEIEVSKII
jgi:predicted nucleotide-binding protein